MLFQRPFCARLCTGLLAFKGKRHRICSRRIPRAGKIIKQCSNLKKKNPQAPTKSAPERLREDPYGSPRFTHASLSQTRCQRQFGTFHKKNHSLPSPLTSCWTHDSPTRLTHAPLSDLAPPDFWRPPQTISTLSEADNLPALEALKRMCYWPLCYSKSGVPKMSEQ